MKLGSSAGQDFSKQGVAVGKPFWPGKDKVLKA
jgi:hypothetical protein